MPLGINTLDKSLPELCMNAGLSRKTSHCLRKTTATRLFQSNVEEKLIRERTGHRSNALFKYEHKSKEQEKFVSSLLGPPNLDSVDQNPNSSMFDNNDLVSDEVLANIDMSDLIGASNVTSNSTSQNSTPMTQVVYLQTALSTLSCKQYFNNNNIISIFHNL